MPTVPIGPTLGLLAQVSLLASLAGTVGLGRPGWAAGLAYGACMYAALSRGMAASGASELGPANRVTLTRATLVGGVAALVAEGLTRAEPAKVLLVLTVVALALDAVDGLVARRTNTASPLGARFDGEVDASLLLILSVHLVRPIGVWVLAIGGMRYAFLVATWALPQMRGTLPPRYWRKVVAATQGVVLAFAVADVADPPIVNATIGLALLLLIESFGRDVVWLVRHNDASGPAAMRRPGPAEPLAVLQRNERMRA